MRGASLRRAGGYRLSGARRIPRAVGPALRVRWSRWLGRWQSLLNRLDAAPNEAGTQVGGSWAPVGRTPTGAPRTIRA